MQEDEIYIVVGSNYLSRSTSFKKSYTVKKLFAHKGYWFADNDIGLIQLNKKIKFNKKVRSIKLPVEKDLYKANYTAVATGWGRIKVKHFKR